MNYTFSSVDNLTAMPAGSFIIHGFANDNIELIQNEQLKNRELWASLVDQFRNGLDNNLRRWRSEYWGKLMRGAALTYMYTLDDGLYEILEETVRDLLSVADGEGRITSYDKEHEFSGWDIWGRKYVLLGLRHFVEISKDKKLSRLVLDAMKRHADYIIEHIGEAQGQTSINETSTHWLTLNSHSILEPMVNLYLMTHEKRYLAFAKYLVDNGGIAGQENNIFELAYENRLAPFEYPANKAYELMSCFEGLLEYARVTHDEKWKRAVINFAERMNETDITVIGCAGCTHEQLDNAKARQSDDTNEGLMQETCVTVTWMKLCYQLLRLTGEAKYADRIERSFYNGLLGAVNTEHCTSNRGFHFDSYSPLMFSTRGRANGGFLPLNSPEARELGGDFFAQGTTFFGCCTAIGAAGLALLPQSAVMECEHGIQINHYFDGSFSYVHGGENQMLFKCETKYPYDGKVKITLNTEKDDVFEMRFRIPAFSRSTNFKIDGTAVYANLINGIISVERVWENGTVIEMEFETRPHAVLPFGEYGKGRYAVIESGPIVLARDARFGADISLPTHVQIDSNGYVTNIKKSSTQAFSNQLCYELDGGVLLVDYASAGKTWNEESKMTAWIAIK